MDINDMWDDEEDRCGAPAVGGPYCLPKGHNRGNLDIPSNHKAGKAKKQEPVAWSRLDTAKSVITENEDIKRGWDLDGLPFKCLFDSPQPCPECDEKQSALDVWEGRYADKTAECEKLKADLAEHAAFREICVENANVQANEAMHYQKRISTLTKERDELVEQLEKLRDIFRFVREYPDFDNGGMQADAIDEALALPDISTNILNRVRYGAHLEAADLVIDLGDDSSTLDARTLTVAANAIRALGTGMEAGK